MLYDFWRQVVKDRAREPALIEAGTGRRWTFRELSDEAERVPGESANPVFPSGADVSFIIKVLCAWRAGAVVCPLEPGQTPPGISAGFPPQVIHLKTTSASAGAPQFVAFTAAQLRADAENIVATMGLHPERPNLGLISLAHSYGFSNLVLPLLLRGIPLVLADSTLPESLRRAAAFFPQLTLPAVPALWQAWHQADAIPKNVQLAISAGAPLPLALEQSVFARHGLKIHNFYGSSECGGIAYDSTIEPRADTAYVGAPLRDVQVSPGENGCLEVRSRAVGEGYWPQSSPALGQGVFRTSDLGEIVDGQIHLRGRVGDQINVAGRKVSPEVIEAAIVCHPQVRACVAFGVPDVDERRGELIVACVAATAELKAESLKQFMLAKLPAWQVPREWRFVDELETGVRGKLSRAAWRRRFLEGKT